MLRVVEGGKSELSERDQELYNDLRVCIESFDIINKETDGDLSKNYLVMGYNLFELGLPTEAMVQIDKITEKYWIIDFLKDMQFAIDRRNEMVMLKGDADKQERFKLCRMEAEFFICGVGVQKHLDEREFKFKEIYDTMVEEFNEIEYIILDDGDEEDDAATNIQKSDLRVIEEESEED